MPDWNWDIIITDTLWFLVIVGWLTLILGGLETDKPLSGGLPGHVNFAEAASDEKNWTSMDRMGALAAWVVFGAAGLILPVVLWWIFTVH